MKGREEVMKIEQKIGKEEEKEEGRMGDERRALGRRMKRRNDRREGEEGRRGG